MSNTSMTRLLLLLLSATAVSGCSPPNDDETRPPRDVHFRAAGATFPAVLYKHWFVDYEKHHEHISIDYDAVGSGDGVKRFLAQEVDFAASDNGMTESEMIQVPRGVVQFPATAGMIAIVYNLDGVDRLRLSREAYTDIFLGRITKWDDPVLVRDNPGVKLPDLNITLVVRLDASGTTFLLSNHLSAINDEWRSGHGAGRSVKWPGRALQQRGNDGVGAQVVRARGSIGYVDLGTALEQKLRMAWLENKSGKFVEPSTRNATKAFEGVSISSTPPLFLPDPKNGEAYPIVGFTYILLYGKYPAATKVDDLKELMKWCLIDGQEACDRLGYIRLSPGVAKQALDVLDKVGVDGSLDRR